MSQIAIIEIEKNFNKLELLNEKTIDGKTYLDINCLLHLPFFDKSKTYINIINDLESRELDMLIFDYEIELNDYEKIFNIISPLFDLVKYLGKVNQSYKLIKLYISENCNVKYDEFIKVPIDYLNIKESFIDYLYKNNIITTNCFPPLMFVFY